MMDWISVKDKLPEKSVLVEVKVSGGGTFNGILVRSSDETYLLGSRYDWTFPSGLYAQGLSHCDMWREICNEKSQNS